MDRRGSGKMTLQGAVSRVGIFKVGAFKTTPCAVASGK